MSQQINLLNSAFVTRPSYFSLPAIVQALGVILLGSLCFYGYASYQVKQLEKQWAESSQRYNAELVRNGALTAEFSTQISTQALQEEAKKLEKKVDEQSQLIETLKAGAVGKSVENSAGYSEYMRAFARQIVPGLWLTGFRIDTAQLSLMGGALNPELLPAYIQRLGHESVMQGKTFADLQMRQGKGLQGGRYIEFSLQSNPASEVVK